MSITKSVPLKSYSSMKFILETFGHFLKVKISPFLTTFAQLRARLKNFLGDWLLVLGFGFVCVKSVVILIMYVNMHVNT